MKLKIFLAVAFALSGLGYYAYAVPHMINDVGDGHAPHSKSPDGTCWEHTTTDAGVAGRSACAGHCGE